MNGNSNVCGQEFMVLLMGGVLALHIAQIYQKERTCADAICRTTQATGFPGGFFVCVLSHLGGLVAQNFQRFFFGKDS